MKYFTSVCRNVKQFITYVNGGTPAWSNSNKGSTYTLLPELQRIADDYLENAEPHSNTRNDARWVTHKYFSWLVEQGYENLDEVIAQQIQKFLVFCAGSMMSNSLYDVKLHMKKTVCVSL